ncbi:MAG: ROK family protein [Bacteroidetes bacterium]|nr:ROK family protein [Bacteroidota bacterium]
MALAEYYFGVSKGIPDSILISVKHGIGAGIMINGKIFRGSHRNAGEIGHIFIEELGLKCNCGNYGCLETVASNPYILKHAHELLSQGHKSILPKMLFNNLDDLNIHHICEAADKGDEFSQNVLKRVGRYLGCAISIVINLFNPGMIIIAGDIVNGSAYFFPSIKKEVQSKALQNFSSQTQIVTAQFNDNETISAFALVKQALLEGKLFSHIIADY